MPIVAGVVGGAQLAQGLYQQYRAGRIRKKAQKEYDANPYQIPEAQTRFVNKMGTLAQSRQLPGQQIMEDRMQSQAAGTVGAARQAATSPSQVLASTLAAYQQQQQNQQNLDLQAAQNYQQRQSQYAQSIASLAPYEQKRWEYRTLYPYQAKLNQAAGLQQQGQQNMQQGIQSGLSIYANDQYLNALKTNPTNGMDAMQKINPIQATTLQVPPINQGLMPMNYRASYWNNGFPDYSIQQRQGNYFPQ